MIKKKKNLSTMKAIFLIVYINGCWQNNIGWIISNLNGLKLGICYSHKMKTWTIN